MNSQQITNAYVELFLRVQPDFYFVLNYQQHAGRNHLSYEQLSAQVQKLFYGLEGDEWGYEERKLKQSGAKKCRIERAVCIECASFYHANVMMKRYGNQSDESLLAHIKRTWLDIQTERASTGKRYTLLFDGFDPAKGVVDRWIEEDGSTMGMSERLSKGFEYWKAQGRTFATLIAGSDPEMEALLTGHQESWQHFLKSRWAVTNYQNEKEPGGTIQIILSAQQRYDDECYFVGSFSRLF